MYITHCSEFAFVYGADFAVSNFEEFLAALDDAEDGDVIGLTANINPAYDFEFTKSVVIDMRSFGFTRAREADGGYKIAIDPDCNLTMMNGGWDIDAAFGDISAEGSNGTCVVNFKNVVFTDLKPGNPGSPLKRIPWKYVGNMTVNVTFENCTLNNVG